MMSFLIGFLKGLMSSMLQLLTFGKSNARETLNVYVKTSAGLSVAVELNPKWDIGSVKRAVAPKLGLRVEEVVLIFAGKELADTTVLEECDLGQRSVLHAVKSPVRLCNGIPASVAEEEASKPFSESLLDLQLSQRERTAVSESDKSKLKAHFYVYCSTCKKLCEGKLRVRCACCRKGTFTVHSDPQSWEDVLLPDRITGECLAQPSCSVILHESSPTFAEFYFKCSEHQSQGEDDEAVPLDLVKPNLKDLSCLSCFQNDETVLVFGCNAGHVTCLDCFRLYCGSRLQDRQFFSHPNFGYTLSCPVGCPNSYIKEIHHFRLMTDEQYDRYQRFATEEYVLQSGGILCPQPGCGMGILAEPECTKITCSGCSYVFCRNCLQGFHIGECEVSSTEDNAANASDCTYAIDSSRADLASYEVASKVAIRTTTKPCPKCRTATERSGGCMHMICTRAGCAFEWCWVCQTAWTRDCMGAHWFG